MRSHIVRIAIVGVFAGAVAAGTAHAQTSVGNAQAVPGPASRFQFNVRVGDTIWVEAADRTTATGRVAAVDTEALELEANGQRTVIPGARILHIERKYRDGVGDGLRRGLATGAIVGALAGGAVALTCDRHQPGPGPVLGDCFPGKGFYFVGGTIFGSVVGLVSGGLADWMTPGRQVAYERGPASVSVQPLIGWKAGGAVVGVAWR